MTQHARSRPRAVRVTAEQLAQPSSIRRDGAISVAPSTAKVDPAAWRRVKAHGLELIRQSRESRGDNSD